MLEIATRTLTSGSASVLVPMMMERLAGDHDGQNSSDNDGTEIKASDDELAQSQPYEFHGEWSCTISPRQRIFPRRKTEL
jgi:hypothetical protein